MTEREFQQRVIEVARLYGWRVAHFLPAYTDKRHWRTPMIGDKGFPDLVLAKEGRIIFAELKSEKGKPTDEQLAWIKALGGVYRGENLVVGVFHPEDFGILVELLSDGRAHAR